MNSFNVKSTGGGTIASFNGGALSAGATPASFFDGAVKFAVPSYTQNGSSYDGSDVYLVLEEGSKKTVLGGSGISFQSLSGTVYGQIWTGNDNASIHLTPTTLNDSSTDFAISEGYGGAHLSGKLGVSGDISQEGVHKFTQAGSSNNTTIENGAITLQKNDNSTGLVLDSTGVSSSRNDVKLSTTSGSGGSSVTLTQGGGINLNSSGGTSISGTTL